MQINEVLKPSEKALTEMVNANNDTGLLTEDVVKIIQSQDGPWSAPMTGDEFEAHLQELAKQHGVTL